MKCKPYKPYRLYGRYGPSRQKKKSKKGSSMNDDMKDALTKALIGAGIGFASHYIFKDGFLESLPMTTLKPEEIAEEYEKYKELKLKPASTPEPEPELTPESKQLRCVTLEEENIEDENNRDSGSFQDAGALKLKRPGTSTRTKAKLGL